jgi:DNA-directed RNA polymerase subunit M/transcription elongation factor TFIIS
VEFCPHCKSALLLEERDGQVVSACSRCGYGSDGSRKRIKTFDRPDQTIFVVEKDKPP